MGKYQPYRFWTRDQLWHHVKKQLKEFDLWHLETRMYEIVYSDKWNPMEDYNGCNLVQDKYHPFPPCLEHDFNWFTGNGGHKTDLLFRNRLMDWGKSKFAASAMFLGVRLGWISYYKWKKR